jgi:hypothetical protein
MSTALATTRRWNPESGKLASARAQQLGIADLLKGWLDV